MFREGRGWGGREETHETTPPNLWTALCAREAWRQRERERHRMKSDWGRTISRSGSLRADARQLRSNNTGESGSTVSRAKVRTNVIRAEYADYNDGAVTSHDRKTRAGALGRTDVVLT